jgi:hypothetical protein
LGVRQDVSLLRDLRFERFQLRPHGFEVVTLPHYAAPCEIEIPTLASSFDTLDARLDSILVIRSAAADFLERLFAATVVQLLNR